jgi:hypothetical protein
MAGRIRVFVSFDFDKDRDLARAMGAWLKRPAFPLEIDDWSLKEAAPERAWTRKARERIAQAHALLVIVGTQTYRAQGVLKEVELARQATRSRFQVIGDPRLISPPRVPDGGRLYRWREETLISALRAARA